MAMMKIESILIAVLISLISFGDAQLLDPLDKSNATCPNVETIVFNVISEKFKQDPSIAPALIRMFFHDCFNNGCDASILLDGANCEKKASPNLSVRGYEVIDAVKDAVEKACPGRVSCADILALSTRDLVNLTSAGPAYKVRLGRLDGFVSLATKVDLPSPTMNVSQLASAFASRGFNITEMVLLIGGHTIGVANCVFFEDRIYNFQNTGKPDPTMDPKLVDNLKGLCPQNSTAANNFVTLDQNSSSANIVDVSFYKQIMQGRGILQMDQELAVDNTTKGTVADIAAGNDFVVRFGEVMVKLGNFGVIKNTSNGEIRKSCRSCNPKSGLLTSSSPSCNTG